MSGQVVDPGASCTLQDELQAAIVALEAGQLAVFPTDTVFGIGVAVRFADSPKAIYEAKKRDAGKPVAWLVDGVEALQEYGLEVPEAAVELAQHHWPGALTIIVKASDAVPRPFQSAQGTIGLRMPASETALSLIRAVGPIATSSANIAGCSDSSSLEQVDPGLLEHAGVAIAGNEVPSGVASTVVDCSSGSIVVLRQ